MPESTPDLYAAQKRWRTENPGYAAEYYRANRERLIAAAAEYARRNPPDPERRRQAARLRQERIKRSGETCSVEECGRPLRSTSLKLCETHYRRHLRGEPLGEIRERRTVPPDTVCALESCDEPHEAHGLCKQHYSDKYYRENTDVFLAARRRRIARLRSLPSEPYTLADLIARDGTACVLCGNELDLTARFPHLQSATVEHLECLSWQDSPGDILANVAASHLTCNVRRHTKCHPAAARKRAELLAAQRSSDREATA